VALVMPADGDVHARDRATFLANGVHIAIRAHHRSLDSSS